MRKFLLMLVPVFVIAIGACATASQPKPRVFFVEPQDGATVGQDVKVVMGIEIGRAHV